ncbi:hypothetical protein Tco_1327887 [Tanacetum coccineum]
MITLTDQEPAQEVKHIWWDVCNCESCLDEVVKIDDDEDLPKKRKSSQQKLKRRYEKGDLTLGLLGEPSGKFNYYEYEQEFPALAAFEHIDSHTKHDCVSFNPQPLPQSYTHTTSPSLNIWTSEQRRLKPSTRKEPTFSQESQSITDVVASTKTPDVLLIQKVLHFPKKEVIFARNYPDKKKSQTLIQALNQVEPVDVSDLESLYSLDDEPSDSVLCTITYSDFSSDDDSDTDSLESDSDFGVHMINPIPHVLPIQEDPPLPLAKINLLTDAYAKPILVIAFVNTGSSHHPTHIQYQQYKAKTHPNLLKPSPLWLNPSFFVSLPFKQNEDVNPTKASHHGMNPDHYQLAKEECEQLVSQADDKFPLLQKKSLFQHLADAKVLSKFDLKSRSSLPVESNAVWLKKNAPSAFQKAMITIFEPILVNTLVYIYDILLFSPDEQSHAELLSKFYSLVTKYGIMLSEKKMEVRVTTIQFFGMEISDRKYQPQPHMA